MLALLNFWPTVNWVFLWIVDGIMTSRKSLIKCVFWYDQILFKFEYVCMNIQIPILNFQMKLQPKSRNQAPFKLQQQEEWKKNR